MNFAGVRVNFFRDAGGCKVYLLLAAVGALLMGQWAAASPQETPENATDLTLAQVVQNLLERNAERTKNLKSLRSQRTYELDYKGFPSGLHAEMSVDMDYQAPDKKEFTILSESGPKWLVNRVLKRLLETEREAQIPANRAKVELNTRNYNFVSLQRVPSADGCGYILTVQPKLANKFLYRGRIWVNEQDFAVCRIEAEPAQNPSMWITKTQVNHRYQKLGDFWLPAENQSVSSLRLNGRATLTIKYSNYKINGDQVMGPAAAMGER